MNHTNRAAVTVALMGMLALAGCAGSDKKDAIASTEHMCSSCHGVDGKSVSPTFPNLAGQQKAYLVAQLMAFRDHSRADPHAHTYMWGMAAGLSDPTIDGLAEYYSQQSPHPAASRQIPAMSPPARTSSIMASSTGMSPPAQAATEITPRGWTLFPASPASIARISNSSWRRFPATRAPTRSCMRTPKALPRTRCAIWPRSWRLSKTREAPAGLPRRRRSARIAA